MRVLRFPPDSVRCNQRDFLRRLQRQQPIDLGTITSSPVEDVRIEQDIDFARIQGTAPHRQTSNRTFDRILLRNMRIACRG